MSAAPAPWMTRARMSVIGSGASPLASEASVKAATPIRKIDR